MRGVFIVVLLCSSLGVIAQDSTVRVKHSEPLVRLRDSGSMQHSPKAATIMSAIIPGLGQVYNKKVWKVGVLYAAGFAVGYGLKYNIDSLTGYQNALIAELDGDTTTVNYWYPNLTIDNIRRERNYYRDNRDRLILGAAALYVLQIVDANVDAHLREFEINKDLSARFDPGYMIVQRKLVPSIGIRIALK